MYYHPDLVPQLLAYQTRICLYACSYPFIRINWYDAAFISTIAINPEMRWDKQFPDGFNPLRAADFFAHLSRATEEFSQNN